MKEKANMEKTLYLIDGYGYVYRAFHGLPPLSNSQGLPTNAAFGFTKMLIKMVNDRAPEYALMLFDTKGPTFRHDIYKEYKANRPPLPDELRLQFPYIREITNAFGFTSLEKSGYEADDLIGTAARLGKEAGFNIIIVTADKDMKQLVSDNVTIWDPMKNKTITTQTIIDELGVGPEKVIDIMALTGDKSDNIPGVPKIGPKTAMKLIGEYGSIEEVYNRIDELKKNKQRENLENHKDDAFLSKKLVTIITDAPIDIDFNNISLDKKDGNALAALFKKLEFRQLQIDVSEKADLAQKKYTTIFTEEELDDLIKTLKKSKIVSVDTETTSKSPMNARLVGISFALEADEAFYIPMAHNYLGAPKQLKTAYVIEKLKPILEDPDIKKIGQNIKYDWIVFRRHNADLQGVSFDTMLASYLINPSKRAHNLDRIAIDFLNHKTITYEDVAGKGSKSIGFGSVPLEKAAPYACEDADITLAASNVLSDRLRDEGLNNLFEEVEVPLVKVLMEMEMTGITVDATRLRNLSHSFEKELYEIEESIYSTAGERFNIKSSKQLGQVLFEKLGLPTVKKTKKKTGYSTDIEVLTTLASQHELPAKVLRYRTLSKLKSTYTDALLELINPETGRIHTSYNQTVTATGRLSSSDPNLQNIPIRTTEGRQIRSAFIPPKGWKLLSADYSQIELRLVAHLSGDEILVNSFNNDEDIHTRTAAEVFQTSTEEVNEELRRRAKAINFGLIYGQSSYGLAKELGITPKTAKTYIDNYFSRYSGVKEYMDKAIMEAKADNKTSTLLGRSRRLPDIHSTNGNVRQAAERTAINTPIQGTAADLIKLAMLKVDEKMKEKNMKSSMLLSVHDEIVFEVPPEETEEMEALARDVMENIWDLSVPLKVNTQYGDNWSEAH